MNKSGLMKYYCNFIDKIYEQIIKEESRTTLKYSKSTQSQSTGAERTEANLLRFLLSL